MAAQESQLTVDDFARLPQPADGCRQVLHHGVIFELPPARKLHTWIQARVLSLFTPGLTALGYLADKEIPFRPTPGYEVWIADVAIFNAARWNETAFDEYFPSVPSIVIEVLSPSNTASKMLARETICLKNGGFESWLVDPQERSVRISLATGESRLYRVPDLCYSPSFDREFPVESFFPPPRR
jgi:Uma2 family endonuclease